MNDPETTHLVEVQINGERYERAVQARELLVHFIRDTLALKGTHIGCDTGNCGACTVLVDGQPMKSCMMLAVQADGLSLETVESLSPAGEELSDLQKAFNDQHAVQCGWCTPGMLMQAKALLERDPDPDVETIRRTLKGNICRCTGYVNIVRAVQQAAGQDVSAGIQQEARA
ncbi:MAG: (2Fe-2S)-binding domain protein [Conexibacter sp.]|jgi:carbon-monoxide dehydrogenase small subunit|nr:(2Fe-2S)-binding domain protein [Conexibacter sp.]